MSFYQWMITRYLGEDTPCGDLAHDMQRDGQMAGLDTLEEILRHLHRRNACKECISALKHCWRDYRNASNITKESL